MCEIHVITTKYTKCPATCTSVRDVQMTADCSKYAATGLVCEDAKVVHMGQTVSRTMCNDHKDEGYGDYGS